MKIQEDYADRIVAGDKLFEVRYNDRGYQKGDLLTFDVKYRDGLSNTSHPLNSQTYEITYVHSGLGLDSNYVVLGIKLFSERDSD